MELFEDDETHLLTINEHYAAAYATKKEKEELSLLRDKYGSDEDEAAADDESETDESEDEEGEELTPAMDVAILKTLARIRRGDPSIYDTTKKVFEEEEEGIATRSKAIMVRQDVSKDKAKAVRVRDMALAALLEPEDDSRPPITHVQKQADLRSEVVTAFHKSANNADEDDIDDILVLRNTPEGNEEDAYRRFIVGEVGEDEVREILALDPLPTEIALDGRDEVTRESFKGKKKPKKANADREKAADEDFLVNYILNRGWVDQSQRRDPTYNEIIQSTSAAMGPQKELVEDDSDFEDITDRFESSYNFRFEEPNAAVVQSHPRTIPSAVRREDETRKLARERRKQRKEQEKVAKQEDLKRLKGLKRKEIEEKLKLLRMVGGKPDIQREQIDLEGDFDPDSHDRQMMAVFDEAAYYQQADDEEPSWDDNIDITDIVPETGLWKNRKRKKNSGGSVPGVDVQNMDAEVEQPQRSTEIRKRKLDEYMDEYFGLDYVDMVGDIPTRFKYTSVPATAYSLTPAEILLATDAELNNYIGVKKYAPYRSDHADKGRSKRLWELKETLKGRSWDSSEDPRVPVTGGKKRKGKKERAREKLAAPDILSQEGLENGDQLTKTKGTKEKD